MAQDQFAPLTIPALLDLLEAVAEALDVPSIGSPDPMEAGEQILRDRTLEAMVAVMRVLEEHSGAGAAAAELRKRLALLPLNGWPTMSPVSRMTGTTLI
ncbi:hypothetical protein [Kitasatospora azatica]|uniref:hypothetical protein n=1 Tax=Kitasatospora azatica TaxID=58347 RepID=UPI00055F9DD7|nr:hypothetical protein [Kitasatospora azatica]